MSKKPKWVKFCGCSLSKSDARAVVSLIEMTAGRFKLHKKFFKDEATFWLAVKLVSGFEPRAGESFMLAVRRIQGAIGRQTIEWRRDMISKVDRRAFLEALGVKLSETGGTTYPTHVWKPSAPKNAKPPQKAVRPSTAKKDEFYKSWEWRRLRMEVLKEHGPRCMCCGATPDGTAMHGAPVRIVVDHIKPLHTHWSLRLTRSNLQVLCDECNQGKGAWDQTDWREADEADTDDQGDALSAEYRAIMGAPWNEVAA